MKSFKGLFKKEIYHIFRDKRTLLILFALPVLQMLLFGYVITNEIKKAHIAIYDKSNDHTTKDIINKIGSSGYFNIVKTIKNDAEIEDTFKEGLVKEVLIFEPEFAVKLEKQNIASVNVITDASDVNTANLLTNYTTAIINDYVIKKNAQSSIPLKIDIQTRMLYNPELKGVFMFVPGSMAMILILICALLTSVAIVREKETGSMEVLLVSPLNSVQIILGKVTPYVSLSVINAISIILLSRFVFGLPMQGSFILLLFECFLFILMSLSLGILISASTNSQQLAMMLSMVALMLPTILLSGFIYPIENMPVWLQWVCKINPATYFIIIEKNIMLKGTGMESIWKETLVIVAYTVLFIGLSVKKFKVRLQL